MFTPNVTVISSNGAGGNHIRWLLLLDNRFRFFGHTTIQDKTKFIFENVYPVARTYDLWLDYEWRYRVKMDELIIFSHPIWDHATSAKRWGTTIKEFNEFNIFTVSSDPDLLLQRYQKFNPTLNDVHPELFKRTMQHEYDLCVEYADNKKGIIIDTVELFTEQLNKNIYNQLTEYCRFDNNYEYCNRIHQRWYQLTSK